MKSNPSLRALRQCTLVSWRVWHKISSLSGLSSRFGNIRVLGESMDKCRLHARGQRESSTVLWPQDGTNAISTDVEWCCQQDSQSAVRRDLELKNVQGTARSPRESPLWCLGDSIMFGCSRDTCVLHQMWGDSIASPTWGRRAGSD